MNQFENLDGIQNINDLNKDNQSIVESEHGVSLIGVPFESISQKIINKNYVYLILKNNNMQFLPSSFDKLISMRSLAIVSNELAEAPDILGNLTNLTILRLDDNRITRITKEIKNLKLLYNLSLANNNLESIPRELAELKNLRFLCLRGNKIQRLPKEIENLKNMLDIDIYDNPMESTDDEENYGLISLEKIFGKSLYYDKEQRFSLTKKLKLQTYKTIIIIIIAGVLFYCYNSIKDCAIKN